MRIGFIGTGAMAQAIARGAVASGVDPATLVFSNRTATKACDLADELGATAASSNVSLARQVDVVILAVKPKDQRTVIKEIAPVVVGRTDVCIVSLAAGRTLDQITQDFGSGIPLIRVMPNVAATVGQSMTALTAARTTEDQVDAVRDLMNAVGRTISSTRTISRSSRPWPRALRPGISRLLILSPALVSSTACPRTAPSRSPHRRWRELLHCSSLSARQARSPHNSLIG